MNDVLLLPVDQFVDYVKDLTGRPDLSDDHVATLKARYETMRQYLAVMIDKGFTITKLTFSTNNHFCGTLLTYKSPTGRYQTVRYVRNEQSLDVIPDDFLHDLAHIPVRAGL